MIIFIIIPLTYTIFLVLSLSRDIVFISQADDSLTITVHCLVFSCQTFMILYLDDIEFSFANSFSFSQV